ncbi:cytochrome c maturation protein CcmE [Roseomonas sp. E05]|uniref:cytochrome c maturation protein CcmE n=1 Tax=Roseomonas sp. E05 TaxID=3046310 RepID=UPI0024BB6406|nr:cytochrome c maturation protein CcmE [Roseomonas sp. E05]MDJ0387648.1 cytochrome c maturation protein CcmE [Roseomonas sp. E05]
MKLSRKRRRLWVVVLAGLGLGTATALALTAFQDNLVFFLAPSDIAAKHPAPDRAFRLGGLVVAGSLQRDQTPDGKPEARFRVTDGPATIPVRYVGVLPDLFREGQGVVALGKLGTDGQFRASEVLARHDETYMPPEVAEALKRTGHWDPAKGAPPPAASWNTLEPAAASATPARPGT